MVLDVVLGKKAKIKGGGRLSGEMARGLLLFVGTKKTTPHHHHDAGLIMIMMMMMVVSGCQ